MHIYSRYSIVQYSTVHTVHIDTCIYSTYSTTHTILHGGKNCRLYEFSNIAPLPPPQCWYNYMICFANPLHLNQHCRGGRGGGHFKANRQRNSCFDLKNTHIFITYLHIWIYFSKRLRIFFQDCSIILATIVTEEPRLNMAA